MALLDRIETVEADHNKAGLLPSYPNIQKEDNIEDKVWQFPESPCIHIWSNSEEDILF